MNYIFIGRVLPESVRVSSFRLTTNIEAAADRPAGSLTVEIVNNYVLGRLSAETEIGEIESATVRNIVRDIATQIANSGAIALGSWIVVTIGVCLREDGEIIWRYDETKSPDFERACSYRNITWPRILSVNVHPEGFSLRLAIDEIMAGLSDPKFMRSRFYRAIETLRHSVAKGVEDRGRQWEIFSSELALQRNDYAILVNHDERHGNYVVLEPIQAAESQQMQEAMVLILSKYIEWFERTYLHK